MLRDHAGDSVWARRFVVRGSPESLLHDSMGDASRDHWDCVLMVGRNAKVPRERRSVRECGAMRQGMGLKFLDLRVILCRVHKEAARSVVSEYIEDRWEGLGVFPLRRGA